MNRVQFIALAVLALSTAAFAGPLGPTSDGMPRYEDFEKRAGSFPYRAPAERVRKVSDGAKLLRLCMTKTEIEAVLGKPDFSQSMFGPKGPNPKWLGFSWVYYLAKRGSTTNVNDPGIQVFFDTSDRAHWIVPTGIEGAREIGAPKPPCP